MKMLKILIYIIISIISLGSACNKDNSGHGDNRLTFVNNSDLNLMILLQYNYPDTTLLDKKWISAAYTTWGISPQSEEKLWNSINWEKDIQQNNSSNMLMIFVIASDTIQTYSWEEIQKNYLVLIRYDLSLQDLESMNWTINYP
jgi:hypothetical protein